VYRRTIVGVTVLGVCLLALSAFAAANGEKIKAKGVITFRTGNTLTVKTADETYSVVFDSNTKIQQPIGLGARKKEMPPDVLIPGLRMKFEGVGVGQNQIQATVITFDSDDLALAQVIQAGLNPTAQQTAQNVQQIAVGRQAIEANQQEIAANRQQIAEVQAATNKRFSEMTDWDVKTETSVYFPVGIYALSEQSKQAIKSLAEEALQWKGYVIEVRGFADSTGGPATNQQLSKNRAESVVAYLLQECQVPVKNIVAPGAMGETNPVASNETTSGRAENRRVGLKVLVNKAVGAGSGK